ncbi:MAG: aspartyl protease family protein [Chitinophagaceae bacterium]
MTEFCHTTVKAPRYQKRLCRMVSALALCLTSITHLAATAQEEFIEPPSRLLTKVPFIQLTGGIIIMQAKLDNFPDTLNFVLDTGSSGISLDSNTAEYLGLKPEPTNKTIRGIAGIKNVSFLYNRKLHLPGLTIDSLNFHINDYSILTAVYGEQIDGIIGYAVLSRYILKLDYDEVTIGFWTRGTTRYPRGGYVLRPAISQLVTQPLRVKDARTINSRFLFDLGAGLCMLYSKDFDEDSSLIDKKRKRYIKQGEGLGGKLDMEMTVIKEVKIGPYRFRSVPVFIFDDAYNVTSYPDMGGLLGNDIMRRFNVTLNYPKGEIYIMPNKHYNEPFDYSYSGMELYLVNGKIVVGDVAKGSPAETAGLKEGDEVVAINKNFSQNLNQYKVALQTPNEKVKLILRRGDKLFDLEFKVKSIL